MSTSHKYKLLSKAMRTKERGLYLVEVFSKEGWRLQAALTTTGRLIFCAE
jgi:hypothetical protein